MKTKALITGILFTFALVVAPFGCKGTAATISKTPTITAPSSTATVPTFTITAQPSGDEVVIYITAAYVSGVAYIYPKSNFMWINMDNKTHSVTSDAEPPAFDFTLAPGQSVETSIDMSGDYRYHDRFSNSGAALIVSED